MASSSPSSLAELASSPSPAQAALDAGMFTLRCDTGFLVAGLQPGEAAWTPNTVLCTLITMTVTSAWIGRRKSIKKLLIFFSHWLRCAVCVSRKYLLARELPIRWLLGGTINCCIEVHTLEQEFFAKMEPQCCCDCRYCCRSSYPVLCVCVSSFLSSTALMRV